MATPSFPSDLSPSFGLKRVRRGTRSCAECRRRKNRCIFSPDARICNGCVSKGSRCIPQGIIYEKSSRTQDGTGQVAALARNLIQRLEGDTALPINSSTKDRSIEILKDLQLQLQYKTNQIESPPQLTSKINLPTPTHTPSSTLSSDGYSVYRGSSSPMNTSQQAPILTMLDNVVLKRDDWGGDVSESGEMYNYDSMGEKRKIILQGMQTSRPSFEALKSILYASHTGWSFWERSFSPVPNYTMESRDRQTFVHFVYESFVSTNPVQVIKAALCLVQGLRQLPKSFEPSHIKFPASLDMIEEHYLVSLDVLFSCDTLASTFDGMECIMVLAQLYADLGDPKKTWLMCRRLTSFAVMAGLHRLSKTPNDPQLQRKRALWKKIWQTERFGSFFLGYPYAVPDTFLDLEMKNATKEEDLFDCIGVIEGRIVDMNQNTASQSFSTTIKLDQELHAIAETMPSYIWSLSPTPGQPLEAYYDIYRLRFWYHTTRNMLHLPYMLASFTDPRYSYSRIAATDSAREMIRSFEARSIMQAESSICSCFNLKVFAAGMTLALDLLGTPSGTQAMSVSDGGLSQKESDWELVRTITRRLRIISEELTCTVADQAVGILDFFYSARNGWPEGMDGSGSETIELVVPSFGRLRIKKGEKFVAAPPKSVPSQLPIQMDEQATLLGLQSNAMTEPFQVQSLDSMPLSSYYPFPLVDEAIGYEFEFGTNVNISFDSYYQPQDPESGTSWPELSQDWTSTPVELDISSDWDLNWCQLLTGANGV